MVTLRPGQIRQFLTNFILSFQPSNTHTHTHTSVYLTAHVHPEYVHAQK